MVGTEAMGKNNSAACPSIPKPLRKMKVKVKTEISGRYDMAQATLADFRFAAKLKKGKGLSAVL